MKKLFCFMFLAVLLVSCGGDSKSSEGENYTTNEMANFFDTYLDTLCTAASKCTSGFVNADNLSFCPKAILNSPSPF